jgi:hypothetical protein
MVMEGGCIAFAEDTSKKVVTKNVHHLGTVMTGRWLAVVWVDRKAKFPEEEETVVRSQKVMIGERSWK